MIRAVTHEDNGTIFCVPKFDRFTALKIAINRAISGATLYDVPYSIVDTLDNFYVRSLLYFTTPQKA